MISFLKYGFSFVLLVLLQVFIINELHFNFLITPLLYVAFIIILPFETPKTLILLLGFFLGLSIDCFQHTIGIHAAAATGAAMLRIIAQQVLSPREGYDLGLLPTVNRMGGIWFLKYAAGIILVHNIIYVLLESFSLVSIFVLTEKIIINSSITLAILFFCSWAFGARKIRSNL